MRFKRLLTGGKVSALPHPFVEEAEWLVHKNHSLVLESIECLERKEISRLCEDIADTPELGSEIAYAKSMADDLRNAANQLALVSLVTRLQHWIKGYAKDLSHANGDTGLVKNLRTLNSKLGEGPVNVDFFAALVTVRDSVIHADSQAEWHHGQRRRVPDRYVDAKTGEVNFTEQHLREAIDVSIKQIEWYEQRLDDLESHKL